MDIRKEIYGSTVDSLWGDQQYDSYRASNLIGTQVVKLVKVYNERFGPRFALAGKSIKYAVLIVGVDTINPDVEPAAIVLSRHEDDGYLWDPGFKHQSILYRPNGTADSLAYFDGTMSVTGAFQSFKDALDGEGFPHPIAVLGDFESIGSVAETGPFGFDTTVAGFPEHGYGFIEIAADDYLTRTQLLSEWMSTRVFQQDWSVLDPNNPVAEDPSPSGSSVDPANAEAMWLGYSAVVANFCDAFAESIIEPFQAVFGSDKPGGEWPLTCASQEHQCPILPAFRRHTEAGNLSMNVQIPKNYCDVPLGRYNYSSNYAMDINWESIWNWLQVWQPPGYSLWTTFPTDAPVYPDLEVSSDIVQRMVLEVQTRIVREAARAAPDKPVVPSISIAFGQLEPPAEPVGLYIKRRERCIPYLVRYMLNSCATGVRQFWLFAPDWNDGSAMYESFGKTYSAIDGEIIRTSNHDLVNLFNKKFRGRVPRRNRVWRHGG